MAGKIVLGNVIGYAISGSNVIKINFTNEDEIKVGISTEMVDITQSNFGSAIIKRFSRGGKVSLEFTINDQDKRTISLLNNMLVATGVTAGSVTGSLAYNNKIKCVKPIRIVLYQELIDCDGTVYVDDVANPYTLEFPFAVTDGAFNMNLSNSKENKYAFKFDLLVDETSGDSFYFGKAIAKPTLA